MPRPGVVLHIGLHKTATRFLQRALFRNLDDRAFLVNPEPLASTLKRAIRHPGAANQSAARDAARRARADAGSRTLVVSDPTISGDMYSQHMDWAENRDLVYSLFPDAAVVYFVRRPEDWLHSAYRQHLLKGRGVPIEFFLNYRDGEFHQRAARKVAGVRNVSALELRFAEIYRGYAETFGAERVYLFRQEDLRHTPERVHARLAEALGLERLPPLPSRVSGNRAFSARAIHLFFPGVYRDPRSRKDGGDSFMLPPRLLRRMRKLRALMIHHLFDRLTYRDWDLLARHGMRQQLAAHYQSEKEALEAVANHILEHGPGPEALRKGLAHGHTEQ